jgi:pimeloyl-ACP methyl ester carboxylesterase
MPLKALTLQSGLFLALLANLVFAPWAHATPRWMTLPPTPSLPRAAFEGIATVNGVRIWYATFGHGPPVILLHGGLANANYWGLEIPELAKTCTVIVMDSRGHGRSSRNADPFGYDLMASDVLALMDRLHMGKAAIVGWSDGAIIGLDIAIHHPERLSGLFAFAANSDPSGVKDVNKSPVFTAFIKRAAEEYESLSPTPHEYQSFLSQIEKMWATQPFFDAQLPGIHVPVAIADADHDEAIKRENTLYMADHIPDAELLILPGTSHFAFIQDPEGFTFAVEHFLSGLKSGRSGSK